MKKEDSMIVAIFNEDGTQLIGVVSRETVMSCECMGSNKMRVTYCVEPSSLNGHNGVHSTEFEISPHNRHALIIFDWLSDTEA